MSVCREEVIVPPSSYAARRKIGFFLNTTDEPFFSTSSRWVAPHPICTERSSQAVDTSAGLKLAEEGGSSEYFSSEKKQVALLTRSEDVTVRSLSKLQTHESVNEKGAEGEEGETKNLISSSTEQVQKDSLLQGIPSLLQCGSLKRKRCSRLPRHGRRISSLFDYCNTAQNQAAKGPSVITNSRAVVCKDILDSDNGVAQKSGYSHSSLLASASEHSEEACNREKCGRSFDSTKGSRGACVLECKQGSLHSARGMHQDCLPQERTASSSCKNTPEKMTPSLETHAAVLMSFERKTLSPERHAAVSISLEKKRILPKRHTASVLIDGVKAGFCRKEFALPALVIQLSRREKAEDFLIFKGNKIPSRPKRRPRAIEKTLLYCTPGNCLSNLSYSRYNVKEKKSIKGKPRGLKAIESSMDIDSE